MHSSTSFFSSSFVGSRPLNLPFIVVVAAARFRFCGDALTMAEFIFTLPDDVPLSPAPPLVHVVPSTPSALPDTSDCDWHPDMVVPIGVAVVSSPGPSPAAGAGTATVNLSRTASSIGVSMVWSASGRSGALTCSSALEPMVAAISVRSPSPSRSSRLFSRMHKELYNMACIMRQSDGDSVRAEDGTNLPRRPLPRRAEPGDTFAGVNVSETLLLYW